MNGIKYYRKKNKLAIYELSQKSNITAPTIRCLEKTIRPNTSLRTYLRLADSLGVTIDELVDDYNPSLLADGDRHAYPAKNKPVHNHIDVYRREENLSLQQLATRMGVTSREWARRVCNNKVDSPKMLSRLAAYEQISVEEFVRRYAVEVCA